MGDRAGAVRTYHRLSGLLELELGVEPDPETARTLSSITVREGAAVSDAERVASSRPGVARAGLIGRDRELDEVLSAWDQARQGRAGVALVRGSAGVGKSRLLSELGARVAEQGYVVAHGRCFQSNSRLSLSPVSDWLRAPGVAAARGWVDRVWRREAERLVPPSDGAGGHSSEVAGAPQEPTHDIWHQRRFFEGVAHSLLAGDHPLLLLLDDLQWCDSDTLGFLTFLFNLVPTAPVLVAAAARPDVEESNASAGAWIADLRRTGLLTEHRLQPLDPTGTAELARQLTGVPLGDVAVEALHGATGGFPLFVVEAARATQGRAPQDAPSTAALAEILRQRLQQTSPDARSTAQLAAAVHRDFSLSLLVEASELDADTVVLAVDELWRHRILRELPEGYDFSHDLMREAAYTGVSPPRRWLLHRRLAEALQTVSAGHPETVAGQLAEQFGSAGDHERAFDNYVLAAREAERVFAHADALAQLHRGLEQLATLPPGPSRDVRELEARVPATHIMLALEGWTGADMESNARRILELARRVGRPQVAGAAMVTLIGVHIVRGQVRQAFEVMEQAVALASPGDEHYAQVHFGRGGAALHLGRCEFAYDDLTVAYRLLGDDEYLHSSVRARVFAGGWLAHATWMTGRDGAAALTTEAVTDARSHDHPYSLAVALAYGVITHQLLDDRESCGRAAAELSVLCEQNGFSYYGEWGRILAGWCRGADGAPAIRRGIATLRAADSLLRMPYWLSLLADVTPDVGEAAKMLAEGVEVATANDERLWLPDLWRRQAALMEDETAARTLLAQASALAREQGNLAYQKRCAADLTARRAATQRAER
jgi:hypothetical protein